MTVLAAVERMRAAGRDVISLCAGEPAGGAPAQVHARAAALHESSAPLGYSPALGITPLREAIADHYGRWYGLDLVPDDVAVTTGSSGAFMLAFLAAFEHGDRVALTRPGYPAYRNILAALGCEVVEIAVGPETGFQPTTALLEQVGPLAGLVLASPANPTGSMTSRTELAEIAAWCAARGTRLVSDEIYHGLTYPEPGAPDPRGTCAWELDDAVGSVVVSSFSKYWGMTGWRLGWALVPADLRDAVDALAGNLALCPPVPAQHAALAAFEPASYAEADARLAELAGTRQVALDGAARLGWGPIAPADGAFYLYAGVPLGRYQDSVAWCRALLEEQGVALVPGVDFDGVDGSRYVRLSFAAGEQAVSEAWARIAAFQGVPTAGKGRGIPG
ncbi:pyridoxal phosphate-dependent aminotransferase [Pseudactinotalea terrae]|uniref:pyridoxal phosphate-dependent aminotransferase n=1 Tax=Pseudactinotalea terrae TaxID=1743262 RepID=UPI0012E24E13|nr:aminotransferase class I/II-fold pyridoxal phosphate-dependent enzyme [Pseudactinotalea terrae]